MRGKPNISREEWEAKLDQNVKDIQWNMKFKECPFQKAVKVSWNNAEPLFSFLDETFVTRGGSACGCLTQWRGYPHRQWKEYENEFTLSVMNDTRIPKRPEDITPEMLPLFKAWQLAKWDYFYGETWAVPA